MFDNFRAWWNSIADNMADPAKLANLKVADLEKALSKAKEQAALVVGRPVALRSDISRLEKQERDYTDKITKLVEVAKDGDEGAKDIARKHANKLAEVRTTLESKREELLDAEEASKSWAEKIEILEGVLRQRRQQAQDIGARSAMAKAEVKLGKTIEDIGNLTSDDAFGKLSAKVQAEEQRAAGYSQMTGVNDTLKEKKILKDVEADSILKEFGL